MANDGVRTATEVIDQAIAENKTGERLLYGFAATFVSVGLLVLIWSVINQKAIFAGIGAATSALCWPAVSSVRRTRKENVAIRLLEAPLSRADTAKEAAEMLHQLFHEIFGDQHPDGIQVSKKANVADGIQVSKKANVAR